MNVLAGLLATILEDNQAELVKFADGGSITAMSYLAQMLDKSLTTADFGMANMAKKGLISGIYQMCGNISSQIATDFPVGLNNLVVYLRKC